MENVEHSTVGAPENIAPPPAIQSADAYVFDIDGTLINTRDLVHWNALHTAMLEAYGVDTSIEGIPYHGMTDLSILRAAVSRFGVDSTRFAEKLPVALTIVCREVKNHVDEIRADVCRSIPAVLKQLDSSGRLLGVASGNLAAVGWMKLATSNLSDFFGFGSFSDQRESRADIFAAAVAEVQSRLGSRTTPCFIGDTPADILAARAVGAPIISVATGGFTREQLARHSPDACVDCCADLFQAAS